MASFFKAGMSMNKKHLLCESRNAIEYERVDPKNSALGLGNSLKTSNLTYKSRNVIENKREYTNSTPELWSHERILSWSLVDGFSINRIAACVHLCPGILKQRKTVSPEFIPQVTGAIRICRSRLSVIKPGVDEANAPYRCRG